MQKQQDQTQQNEGPTIKHISLHSVPQEGVIQNRDPKWCAKGICGEMSTREMFRSFGQKNQRKNARKNG